MHGNQNINYQGWDTLYLMEKKSSGYERKRSYLKTVTIMKILRLNEKINYERGNVNWSTEIDKIYRILWIIFVCPDSAV